MLTRDRVQELYETHLQSLRAEYPDKAIDLKTAAAELGCDYRTLQSMKGFPLMKVGRTYRVRLDSLAKWMADREV